MWIVAGALAAFLSTGAGDAWSQEITYFRTDTPEFKASAKFGKQMFDAYQCAKCHATREGQPLTDDIVAPNLILSKERLRPDYNPIYDDEDAHVQYKIIVAIRDYLMILGTPVEAALEN
jgi:hypothetical protein